MLACFLWLFMRDVDSCDALSISDFGRLALFGKQYQLFVSVSAADTFGDTCDTIAFIFAMFSQGLF